MDALRLHYALCLIRDGRHKDLTIPDRLFVVSERLASSDTEGALTITDRGRDKIRRKGK